ncbi:hypothetical protein CROQUDRAFT_97693 [Cronartium quercuum f. sp. fusiforme G11]|uniref:Uncharacterized protein n=1 Tax=Cronartium quercuum f. sp. fusiforme G11 TaxID=708437 RepID=A0A9P6T868_9BASI|nr:hypothetical protein CROQUDRAFT_97693 [Cronartium quercuum f. sp. fusiforme G11]
MPRTSTISFEAKALLELTAITFEHAGRPILDRRKTRWSSSRFNGRVTGPKIRHRTVTWATALTCNHIGAVILLDRFGNGTHLSYSSASEKPGVHAHIRTKATALWPKLRQQVNSDSDRLVAQTSQTQLASPLALLDCRVLSHRHRHSPLPRTRSKPKTNLRPSPFFRR